MSHHSPKPTIVARLQEFSIPLMTGVIVALVCANTNQHLYHSLVHEPLHNAVYSLFASETTATNAGLPSVVAQAEAGHSAHAEGEIAHHDEHEGGHSIFSMAFIINDIFMVFFFGIAAKEITEACLPGGALNPPSKAINPLMATLGGVLGPIGTFLMLNACFGNPEWTKGWGIPTATDIALAWLVARIMFGKGHPAISFLLLLAIADDAIGLGIIAFAYPDPLHPVEWFQTAWILPGIVLAATMRKLGVQAWLPYVALCGGLCWWGLYSAHLHPALALVFVVPFIPGPKRDMGLYQDAVHSAKASPLEKFEHDTKLAVDFGLFFFAFANAGVSLSGVNNLTWIVLASLIIGKTTGITLFSLAGARMGFPLPDGLGLRHLVVIGSIAGLGLTVALFVSNQAFAEPAAQGAAKMGALLSVVAAGVAYGMAQLFGMPLKVPALSWARLRQMLPNTKSVTS